MYLPFLAQVTLAAKMENSGQPDRIQMTLKSYQLLSEQFPEFRCLPRGGVRLEVRALLLSLLFYFNIMSKIHLLVT